MGGLIETADHIEKSLTPLAHHHGTGALERAGQCGGIFDALAIAARRDADLLECREAIERMNGDTLRWARPPGTSRS
jgi:hypothetical protein